MLSLLGACALAAPASAQIIATSIPKELATGGKGGGGRFALHLMASPFAKWKLNTFQEDSTSFLATSGNPKSKFLGAAEIAFKATDDVSIGVGGWYNKIGTKRFDYAFFLLGDTASSDVFLAGPVDLDLDYTEGHANIFYKDFGVQAGIVHSSQTVKGISATVATVGDISLPPGLINPILADVNGAQDKANDFDAYAVYKVGSGAHSQARWNLSLGAGMYRYDIAKKTVFSGFATGSVDIYKGLGIDASFWYVGKTKRSELQTALAKAGIEFDQNLSRFMVGIGYTFSQ